MVDLEVSLPNTSENLSKAIAEASVTYEQTDKGGRYILKAGIELAALNLENRTVNNRGAAVMYIKHPIDKHDPLNTLKKAFGTSMKELGLPKLKRAILWALLLKNYPFDSFVTEYNDLVAMTEAENCMRLLTCLR